MTQAIMERRRRAKAAEGAKLTPDDASAGRPIRFAGRVRFYVAADFRNQHPHWRDALRDLLDEVNPVTRAAFGATLEEDSLNPWDPACDAQSMQACLEELRQRDPGDAETWVVGVLGAVPRFTTSLDDLGMAGLLGQHAVVRDVWDQAEREVIDRAFASHSQARRDEIYQRRKRHRRLAVFLHEWGHTLGAVHARESDDLLHPQYDDRMHDFGSLARGIIEASLRDRFAGDESHARLSEYLTMVRPGDAMAGDLEKLKAVMQQKGRAAEGASAQALPTRATPAAKHALELPGDEATLLAELSEDERTRYRGVVAALHEHDHGHAYQLLAPLAAAQPKCLAVQHLGCGLAMQLGDMEGAQRLCPRVQRLQAAQGGASAAR